MELIILIVIVIFVITYRKNTGENVSKFFTSSVSTVYNKYAPYNFKTVREKTKELGEEYTIRQYITQALVMALIAGVIAYLYFFSILMVLIYAVAVVMFIPYLAYLRCKRVYNEFVFEQIQVYTTNTIMEFNVTQSFVKSLEGVRDSGILEDPVLEDVKVMIDMSYQNGTIDESIIYFNEKYPYYMVKNMHQLFLQITKEGAKDSGEALENMAMDIDTLVEGVYRDKMDRQNFHTRFITFGLALFFLVMALILLLGKDNYMKLLEEWYIQLLLHVLIIVNAFFLLSGEKYYNEDIGGE